MLKAIIGVEITIDEVQCKYKLSQNRPAADHQGVVDQLDQLGSEPLANAMRKTLF
jgi:transcriptional regulator